MSFHDLRLDPTLLAAVDSVVRGTKEEEQIEEQLAEETVAEETVAEETTGESKKCDNLNLRKVKSKTHGEGIAIPGTEMTDADGNKTVDVMFKNEDGEPVIETVEDIDEETKKKSK